MQGDIIARLKTGSIKNIIPFGSDTFGLPPYVVVKTETGINQIRVRIILHIEQGTQQLYKPYIFDELSELLKNYRGKDNFGNNFILRDSGDWKEASAVSDDKTLSMERIFYSPFRTH